jgi:hypothetical protein
MRDLGSQNFPYFTMICEFRFKNAILLHKPYLNVILDLIKGRGMTGECQSFPRATGHPLRPVFR